MKKIEITIITIGLFLILMSVFGIKASGRERAAAGDYSEKYRTEEREYVDSVRAKLTELGYSQAGLVMTKVVNEDGTIIYTLTIHHSRIDKMNEYERKQLSDIITEETIDVENSTVVTEYLEYM